MLDGKKQYEVMNPSDPYTVLAEDDLTAAIAVLLLGKGQLSLHNDEDEEVLPLFLFGGKGRLDSWMEENGVDDLAKYVEEHAMEVADVLDSMMLGSRWDRASYEKGLSLIESEEKREEWRAHWLDKRRTSINDFCSAAWALAEDLRKKHGDY